MSKDTKNDEMLYTRMLDMHKHVFEQLRYAETKCGTVTAINLAFFAVLARMAYVWIQSKNFKLSVSLGWVDWTSFALFIICITLCLLCLLNLIKAFYPQLNKEEQDLGKVQGNIYFFENVATIGSKNFFKYVKTKFGVSGVKGKDALIDLSNQICILSQITSEKHKNCKKALSSLKWGFPFFVLFVMFSSFSTQAQGAVIM